MSGLSVLVIYGGVLVLVGGFVLANLVTPSQPVDEHALRWHVFVWDLWFLVWGFALGLAAWRFRSDHGLPVRPRATKVVRLRLLRAIRDLGV